jgi:hypothetical protein
MTGSASLPALTLAESVEVLCRHVSTEPLDECAVEVSYRE